MQLTVKLKLHPNPFQAEILRRTVSAVNSVCNDISGAAFNAKTFRRFDLHKLVYRTIRDSSKLNSAVVCEAIARVADAYKKDRKTKRRFRTGGAIRYTANCASWKAENRISLWAIGGRQHVPYAVPSCHQELFETGKRGSPELSLCDGCFYLLVPVEVAEPQPKLVTDYLGVDLGISNIAVDSDGVKHSGGKLNGLRVRYQKLRRRLQAKKTNSARRLLKKRRRKEARFTKDLNHCISKQLVQTAERTNRGIALEDLGGIRDRVTASKPGRVKLHGWSFHQLRFFITYKARRYGVPVVIVNPKNTSRECSVCGHIDKKNRKSRDEFLCIQCAHASCADWNAARVISRRAQIPGPYAGRTRVC